MLRIRDFIETDANLIFAVVSYHHPVDRYLAFLRYYPAKNGGRRRGDNRYNKVASTQESFDYLEKKYPEHIFTITPEDIKLQSVSVEKVSSVHHPSEKLADITSNPRDKLEMKVKKLSELFNFVSEDKKGISGSLLVDLHDPGRSDIDFVIYGTKNYEMARKFLKESFQGDANIRPLSNSEWITAYQKRFPVQKTLSFDEFLWHEKRKYHKGVIDGTIFDILLVRDFDEIKQDAINKFSRYLRVKVRCQVLDSMLSFDSPSVYKVKCNQDKEIREVVSYTHTYAGQACDGEEIEVSGFLEKSVEGESRIVVGTTREATGEYIKVVKNLGEATL